jgi:hypothetical protein
VEHEVAAGHELPAGPVRVIHAEHRAGETPNPNDRTPPQAGAGVRGHGCGGVMAGSSMIVSSGIGALPGQAAIRPGEYRPARVGIRVERRGRSFVWPGPTVCDGEHNRHRWAKLARRSRPVAGRLQGRVECQAT